MEHIAIAALVVALLAVVAHDAVLQRRIAKLERRAKNAEADAGAKTQLATVAELVSGLVRELKTPLQGVLGNTEVMLTTGDRAPTEELRDIHEHAARAADIVRNLVAFTDTTVLTRRWQDLNEIAARAVDLARPPIAAAGNLVSFTRGDRLPVVYVDGRQLERSVAALLGHAGAVRSRGVPRPIVVSTKHADDHLIVDIEFPNVSQEALQLAVAAGELDACRHVIRAHGGRLGVDSRRGGAGIVIELPAAVVDGGPAPEAPTSEESSSPWTTSSTSSTSTANGTSTS